MNLKSIIFYFISLFFPYYSFAQSLFLIAGQSNAVGMGCKDGGEYNAIKNDKCFEYNVLDNSVININEPVGQTWKSLESSKGCIVPAFADTFQKLSGDKVCIVTAARGGSSCHSKAELSDYGTWDINGKLFGDAINKTNKAIKKTGIDLKGIIWLQGERDANAILDGKLTAEEYYDSLVKLIERFRNIYGENLQFYIVQTGYQTDKPIKGSLAVRRAQLKVSENVEGVYIAYGKTNLFPEKGWLIDNVHYSQDALNDIGKEVAGYVYSKEKEVKDLSAWKGKSIINYDSEAKNWNEALPIGNGFLGGMVFGRVSVDRIQLNEISLMTGNEEIMGDYQPLGDLLIYTPIGDYRNYRRVLSLDDALCKVTFDDKGILYTREYFSSNPDSVIVIRLSSNKSGMIDAAFSLFSNHANKVKYENNEIYFDGTFENGLEYSLRARILNDGGSLSIKDNEISVKEANSITVIMSAATSYILDYKKRFLGDPPQKRIFDRIEKAASKSYDSLLDSHMSDYRKLFSRVSLNLGDQSTNLPINKRLENYRAGKKDPALEALLFQYGRYLLISSSRKGGLPANLQGIWNQDIKPAWRCQYTTNINLQMNYWPSEVTNLSECHEPLFDWLEQISNVQKNSKDPKLITKYGWKAYSTMNLMGGTTAWAIHMPGPAWLLQHYYIHYIYTGDKIFLRNRAYPMIKDQVLFWEHFLVETDKGELITPQGWSPEHGPGLKEGDRTLYPGVSYDQQIVYDLFTNYVEICDILDIDDGHVSKIRRMIPRLLKPKVGKWGQLQEWMEDWDTPNDNHRHISHLFAVYPGRQISPMKTPELAKAALVSLKSRGIKSTGWSTAWKINMYARLYQGDGAYSCIKQLINESIDYNLFDLCPPFQIDGNFGYTAGVAEMLMQSHEGFINLLPALPKEWKNGSVYGLKARGGFELSFEWKDCKVTNVSIKSDSGGTCRLFINGKFIEKNLLKNKFVNVLF